MNTGYGVIHVENLPPGDYRLQVVNFGNKNTDNDFTISLYSETRIEILEERKALEDSIQRLEQTQPTEIITSTIKNKDIDQTGKSYLDETK